MDVNTQRSALRARQHGFTLIELCITTTIVGLLTAMGVASYRNALLRAHRNEARLALLEIHAAQERHYLTALRYTADLADLSTTTTAGSRYQLSLDTSEDGQRYTAHARPMPGSAQAADAACVTFSLGESGQRSGSSPECWP